MGFLFIKIGAPYETAFDTGDDPAMIEVLRYGMASPSRPPNGTHGKGGGSNYPLSGWKHYVFEGGVRSTSFVYSADLANPGTVHHGLFHAVDWLPTLAARAGAGTAANLPLDGFDLWDAIQAGGKESPRSEIPVEIAACGDDFNGTNVYLQVIQGQAVLPQLVPELNKELGIAPPVDLLSFLGGPTNTNKTAMPG